MSQPKLRIVMLNDSQGRALVILPGDELLNLVSVWKHTQRQLQPLSAHDSETFFSQDALSAEKGIRQLLTLPVLIDTSCKLDGDFDVLEPNSNRVLRLNSVLLGDNVQYCKVGISSAAIDAKQPEGNDVAVITRAVEKFTTLRIKQRLEDTLGLPTLPPTAQKIIELRADPNAGVDDLVPIVQMDPSLSAQVMSWAASPYYAAPGGIDSIHDAIVRVLGYDLVVNLALGVAMGRTLQLPTDTPRGSTPYWLQALFCATLSEKLAKLAPADRRPRPGLVYLTGLLHNFGYLTLAHIFPPHFSLVSRYIEANPHLHHEYIEKQILNVTREQIGAWLMETWNLPEEVIKGIRYQNSTSYDGDFHQYAQIIDLSLRVMRINGMGDGPAGAIPSELYEQLGLDAAKVQETFQLIHEKTDQLDEMTNFLEAG
ncbi:HDOD domain-containing protein [Motiliproteus coralliicola]|uniref:HDOD domain-containing protein n=1 Tax=Motiliproteus coralliicola TaxID=2283196 RepID=A0A369WCU5_9GAMM|nr:HDOD domain-containing protein [Motiliproteus coralliicola]RDE18999.1 HDOD domain-containing protein [Motiliproteus coralliicola]